MLFKISFPKSFANFTGKELYWSLFKEKLQWLLLRILVSKNFGQLKPSFIILKQINLIRSYFWNLDRNPIYRVVRKQWNFGKITSDVLDENKKLIDKLTFFGKFYEKPEGAVNYFRKMPHLRFDRAPNKLPKIKLIILNKFWMKDKLWALALMIFKLYVDGKICTFFEVEESLWGDN